jgi:hypothetical protein
LRDQNDEFEASQEEGLSPVRRRARKIRDRGARKTPGRRPSFIDEEPEDSSWEATVAETQRIEGEETPTGGPVLEEPVEEEPAPRKPEAREEASEAPPAAPAKAEELGIPSRRMRGPSGAGRGLRERGLRGIPLALPLSIAAALVTLVFTILFTRLGKIDYSNFVFWFVIFTLAAHLTLRLKGGGSLNLGLAPLFGALIALPVSLPNIPYGKIPASGCVQVVWIFLFGTVVTLVTRLFGELTKEDVVGMLIDFTGVGFTVLVFYAVMKILPQKPELLGHYTPGLLVSVAISAGVLFLFYLGKSSYIMAQEGHFSPGQYLQSALRKSWFAFLIIGFIGTLMGLIFVGIGMWQVLFVLPLLPVIMYSYDRVAATDQYLIETIRVLSVIPEETGMIEKGHADRVARLSAGVARELGLSPEDAKQVEYAAYLHDIGAITMKGGPDEDQQQLTEAEGVIVGGVDILGQVDYLEVAAEILRGREGLRDRVFDVGKRRAVSLGAGILRAVDDFESLVHGGEGREPLSENDALTEMNLERGVRYDSKVLRAIARLYPMLPKEGLAPIVAGSSEEPEFWSEQ